MPTDDLRIWALGALDDELVMFSAEVLAARKWVAVPVESALHFDEADAKCLSVAILAIREENLVGILVEEARAEPPSVDVSATKDGLMKFSEERSLFSYMLVPRSRRFAVLCTVHDYYIVAGDRDFVEHAIGEGAVAASMAFARFIEDRGLPQREVDNLRKVHAACASSLGR